jgi:AraC-like DNA-binding protein
MSADLDPGLEARLQRGAALAGAGTAAYARFSLGGEGQSRGEAFDHPWMTFVLTGSKEVRSRGATLRARAWEVLLLPAESPLELTCIPDPATRRYHALDVALSPEALSRWMPREVALGAAASTGAVVRQPGRVALTAFVSFCEAVLEPAVPPRMLEHQLEGVLLALRLEDERHTPAATIDGARTGLDDLDLSVRELVRAVPGSDWNLCGVARSLGVSAATLRRRLSRRGTGLRRIIHEERMRVARTLLGVGRLNVAEVAFHCGYESPAKFSRQFRRSVGVLPSTYRRAALS